MRKLILTRQNVNDLNFDELDRMLRELRMFLRSDVDFGRREWVENLKTIMDFQDEDGSFRLLDSYRVDGDMRVDFCHVPTYICTAILMKVFMTDRAGFTEEMEAAMKKGLKMSCARRLRGHGYEAEDGYRKALAIFHQGGGNEFVINHPDMCPEFTEILRETLRYVRVFVYGTLMKGESNHDFMSNSILMDTAVAEGYDMYDVGCYPAIVPGSGKVRGELYQVPVKDIARLDMLEGEGSLYNRRTASLKTSKGRNEFALVYEYNCSIEGLEKIDENLQPYTADWKTKRDYVWYVSYGSNMLQERFMHYIKGGAFEGGGAWHDACVDTSDPADVRSIEIPYNMYFGNASGSWEGGGVSFLDTTEGGHAIGVAYLITREQFEHVAAQENGGRFPDGCGSWYENIVSLGSLDGYEVVTITNNEPRIANEPCEAYLETLRRGISENYPDMTRDEIDEYLKGCKR